MVRGLFIGLMFWPAVLIAQDREFTVPEKISTRVNTEYEEMMPLVSPDAGTLYFARFSSPENIGGKYTGSDVWISTFETQLDDWGKARNAGSLFNSKGNSAVVGISADGNSLYLLQSSSAKKTNGIYVLKRSGKDWGKPEFLPIPGIDTDKFLGIYVSPDFDVIFLSMETTDGHGEEDLYVSFKDAGGLWTKPKNLGPSINTKGFEISPFLSPNKQRLYFSSNGHKGLGDADIFFSDRLYNSWETWSTPQSLGEPINSKGFDAYFSIYGDSVAYLASNRSNGASDIYRTRLQLVTSTLPEGRRYLTKDELREIIQPGVLTPLIFEKDVLTVSSAQNEVLWYVANRILSKDNLHLQIIVEEEESAANTARRMSEIVNTLRLAGIPEKRIQIVVAEAAKPRPNKNMGKITVRLFK